LGRVIGWRVGYLFGCSCISVVQGIVLGWLWLCLVRRIVSVPVLVGDNSGVFNLTYVGGLISFSVWVYGAFVRCFRLRLTGVLINFINSCMFKACRKKQNGKSWI